jgi:hypothetical protein
MGNPSQSIGGHAMKTIIWEQGVEAGGAWRFRPQDAAITIRTAAKYPSDGGFHPLLPRQAARFATISARAPAISGN